MVDKRQKPSREQPKDRLGWFLVCSILKVFLSYLFIISGSQSLLQSTKEFFTIPNKKQKPVAFGVANRL